MAVTINKVILVGTLGQDPKVTQMKDGKNMMALSVATNDSWKDKTTGEKQEKTEWHRVVVFGDAIVNILTNILKKGTKVYVEGQLNNKSWMNDQGQKQSMTQVVINGGRGEVIALDSKLSGNNFNSKYSEDNKSYLGNISENFDDEIPF